MELKVYPIYWGKCEKKWGVSFKREKLKEAGIAVSCDSGLILVRDKGKKARLGRNFGTVLRKFLQKVEGEPLSQGHHQRSPAALCMGMALYS